MYSPRVRHLLLNPVNGPKNVKYDTIGEYESSIPCRTNPKRIAKNRAKFMLCIEAGKILGARWEAFGDPVALAVASWCVMNIKGKQIDELAHVITPENAALVLDITDELDIRGGCMTVIRALIAALDSYQEHP
jgi:NifU-like protein involved in Fe-S cluster formation